MPYGFELGRSYNRREDIHRRFGGQQQGGIVTPARHPLIIIITGEEGLAHGYADRYRPDGVFEYFGEGQRGDMTLTRGNAAIALHARDGKDLLLFRKTKDGLRFDGEMVYEKHHSETAADSAGAMRSAIVFELRSLQSIQESLEDKPPATRDIAELRRAAWRAADSSSKTSAVSSRTVFQRSVDVRDYILARARGICEGCRAVAPFKRPDGSPYLEPHHIRRLSDGGPDQPNFVIALCPNCHRRVHSGADGPSYNNMLLGKMPELEPAQ